MTRGAPCSFKRKLGLKGRKLQGHQIDSEKDKNNEHFQTYFLVSK